MIKSKVLAMCVCPALAAPPTILAVSPPARHAVVHVLHHAANRLERHVAPFPTAPQTAAIPCAPSLAAADGSSPVAGSAVGGGLGGLSAVGLANLGDVSGDRSSGQSADGNYDYYGGGGGRGGGNGRPGFAFAEAQVAGNGLSFVPISGLVSPGAPVVPINSAVVSGA